MEGNFGGGGGGDNVGEFGESSMIRQTSKLVFIINNPLANLLVHQIFFSQLLKTSQFVNVFPCQSFPPYSTL